MIGGRREQLVAQIGEVYRISALPLSSLAQSRSAPAGSVARAERAAVDLKQGMTLDEVRQLLGKPRRTAAKTPR